VTLTARRSVCRDDGGRQAWALTSSSCRDTAGSVTQEGEAEVGVPVRGLTPGRIGGDLVQVDVKRDAIQAGRADRLLPGDACLLGELAQRRGEQAGIGCVEMPAG
jgi:hypothetical protein